MTELSRIDFDREKIVIIIKDKKAPERRFSNFFITPFVIFRKGETSGLELSSVVLNVVGYILKEVRVVWTDIIEKKSSPNPLHPRQTSV